MTSASEPTQEQTQQPEEHAEEQQAAPSGRQRQPQQRPSRSRRGAAATQEAEAPSVAPKPRLLETYRTEIVPAMMGEFEFKSVMEVPRLQKIVLNIGLGEALTNSRAMESATRDLSTISGQKAIITRARKSIATFKIREGNPIGACVTLRGARMYHFLDRLINTALPRIRDFRGISRRGFDGRGNFSMGIREQIIFPEIDYNQIDRIRGFQITMATSAKNDAEAMRLLELFGMPFVRET
jgi:large subunit ribosomal protein L5